MRVQAITQLLLPKQMMALLRSILRTLGLALGWLLLAIGTVRSFAAGGGGGIELPLNEVRVPPVLSFSRIAPQFFSNTNRQFAIGTSRQMTFATGCGGGCSSSFGMAEIFARTSEPMLPSTRS